MRRSLGLMTALAVGVAWASAAQAADRSGRAERGVAKGITLRLVSDTAQSGFSAMRERGGDTIYVAGDALLTEADIAAVSASGSALEVTLTPEAMAELRNESARRLAIVQGSRLSGVGDVQSISANVIRISNLTTSQANRLSRTIEPRAAAPVGGVVEVIARQDVIAPGDVVTVDVFLSGMQNISTYQIMLEAIGGDSGSLSRTEAWIDADRSDYVFGALQVIRAVDDIHGRMGGVIMDGAVSAPTPRYLGTYSYQASGDAAGDFMITARPVDSETFVHNPEMQPMAFRIRGSTITVGQ